ncbi:hypothetical protein PVT68_08045 [Microbulbifer bruguierae]|uniref:VanZ-like domain-containing protein n=1 Tax=Microbulbifer bruguierae TaxID=3029061 RepID=A0ABY8NIQ3_9GAMM|nr:hypothetical protein [Microbulbifer bruguierae]WGL18234.1 hypothetical protein PVT68_08045 [Microbulbifer bruguierae]
MSKHFSLFKLAQGDRHAGKWRMMLIAVLLGCLYAGLRPDPLPQPFPNFDLLLHFFACLTITYIFVFAFRPPLRGILILTLLLATVALEIAQGIFLTHRSASLTDCLAGIAGIPIGWLQGRWVRRWLRHWSKHMGGSGLRIRNRW